MTSGPFAMRVERLHDGHRWWPDRDVLVVVEGAHIAEVGPARMLAEKYARLPLIHHEGAVLTPGWIDTHAHTTLPGDGTAIEEIAPLAFEQRVQIAARNLQRHLRGGVTTVRDLGSHLDYLGWPPDPATMPRLIRYGMPITAEQGHMHWFGGALGDGRASADIARANLDAGAEGLKLVGTGGGTVGTVPHHTTLTVEELRAAIEIAHAQGRRATVHALTNEAVRRASQAGADGVEHVGFLDVEGESALDPEALEAAIAAGVVFGSTLGCNEAYLHLPAVSETQDYREQRIRTDYYRDNARRLLASGARIAIGSDAGWKHTPFGEFRRELQLLASAGMPAEAILTAATSGNADALGAEGVTGQVRPGHPADLTVIDSADLAARPPNVLAVVRGGIPVGHVGP